MLRSFVFLHAPKKTQNRSQQGLKRSDLNLARTSDQPYTASRPLDLFQLVVFCARKPRKLRLKRVLLSVLGLKEMDCPATTWKVTNLLFSERNPRKLQVTLCYLCDEHGKSGGIPNRKGSPPALSNLSDRIAMNPSQFDSLYLYGTWSHPTSTRTPAPLGSGKWPVALSMRVLDVWFAHGN